MKENSQTVDLREY